MKENSFQSFMRQTYNSSSPLPYILTIVIALFVLLKVFNAINVFDEQLLISSLSLSPSLSEWLFQPWSLLTYPFIYTEIFSLIFDCLWLYWIGGLFLNLLRPKQLLYIFSGGLVWGGVIFLLLSTIPILSYTSISLISMTNGIGALLGAMLLLSPKTEVNLALFGIVKLKTIAVIYFAIELISLIYSQQYTASVAFAFAVSSGILFIMYFQRTYVSNQLFNKTKNKHLKIIHRQDNVSINNNIPNQEVIDKLLDKISESGYESLTKTEKEILFKASNNK